ncbi:MAG: hypothetical protein FOGNACKC_04829 [Anaerolineae bacterium]|nr:hypothetical protein [Anaerolineae bacterium]
MISFSLPTVNWRPRRQDKSVGVVPLERSNLSQLAAAPANLPEFVHQCPVAMKYLHLLGPLDWDNCPERPEHRPWPGPKPQPRAPFVAAYLVKLHEQKKYMSGLRDYLIEHPALVWLLGFKLEADSFARHGFDVEASVPSRKQLGRVLRELDNAALQFLLSCTIDLIRRELPPEVNFGQEISMDTKHIVAWVQQNNPKAWLKESERLDKTRQPQADRDCKLGCKKKSNQQPKSADQPASGKQKRATQFSSDQYFWGYNSGTVTTKVPGYGEFVLAELTQTFDKGDTTFFFPLMAATEARLGFQPPFGALDAGFEAWYVFDYFHQAGGFAAIPATERNPLNRQFDAEGLPLCAAGLSQPLLSTFNNRRGLVPQQMGRYGCPLLHPQPTGANCPIDHKKWPTGGCLLKMGISPGARLRYQLDRKSAAYKKLYRQRSATERINSQATELGIEQPRLRNQRAIANQTTLIYVLINLRAVHRLRDRAA